MSASSNSETGIQVWLEMGQAARHPIENICSIGRANTNHLILPETKVSRRHALIHNQGEQEFWLVDLGSSNGTHLNGRRLTQPARLKDRDQIMVGSFNLVFRQPATHTLQDAETITEVTLQEVRTITCWMVLTDLIGSTQLSKTMSPDDLSRLIGDWLGACKGVVEKHRGAMNQFLGDGFLAYWLDTALLMPSLVAALQELKTFQKGEQMNFRVAVHWGEVTLGHSVTRSQDMLMGKELNFLFRMEKLAAQLRAPCLASAVAAERLKTHFQTTSAGCHALAGFPEPAEFFIF